MRNNLSSTGARGTKLVVNNNNNNTNSNNTTNPNRNKLNSQLSSEGNMSSGNYRYQFSILNGESDNNSTIATTNNYQRNYVDANRQQNYYGFVYNN